MPVRTPRGSAFIAHLLLGDTVLVAEDGEVGAVHAAQIAAAALFRGHYVRRVIALGVERRRERQDLRRAELHAETAGLAALDDNLDCAFCHRDPHGYRNENRPNLKS